MWDGALNGVEDCRKGHGDDICVLLLQVAIVLMQVGEIIGVATVQHVVEPRVFFTRQEGELGLKREDGEEARGVDEVGPSTAHVATRGVHLAQKGLYQCDIGIEGGFDRGGRRGGLVWERIGGVWVGVLLLTVECKWVVGLELLLWLLILSIW